MTPRNSGSTGFLQLLRERRTRDAIYHAKDYWDARANARTGLSRSLWPSNTYNALWDERQRDLIARTLGDWSGRRMLDVGCGTGRMTRFLASGGAEEVTGVDFSEATVRAAREETLTLTKSWANQTRFHTADVLNGFAHLEGTFDDVLVLGCLSVACQSADDLQVAFRNIASAVSAGGRVLVLEPIHRSPLLRRVLDLGIEEWIALANRAGLELVKADRMGFVPVRLVCSVRDVPQGLVAPIFRAGENVLDRAPFLAALSDYKLLLFRMSE
jgi:SAM-dependent methyltransferase